MNSYANGRPTCWHCSPQKLCSEWVLCRIYLLVRGARRSKHIRLVFDKYTGYTNCSTNKLQGGNQSQGCCGDRLSSSPLLIKISQDTRVGRWPRVLERMSQKPYLTSLKFLCSIFSSTRVRNLLEKKSFWFATRVSCIACICFSPWHYCIFVLTFVKIRRMLLFWSKAYIYLCLAPVRWWVNCYNHSSEDIWARCLKSDWTSKSYWKKIH